MDAFAKELKDKAKLKALHILVANAGVFMPTGAEKTAEGFDAQLGVNHVGTVYLTQLLLPLLKAGKPSRCVAGAQEAARARVLRLPLALSACVQPTLRRSVVVVSSSLASYVTEVPWEDLGGEQLADSSMQTYGA
jgi:NAD(P)-dependent dehydrogenase (short-subunit alcohol dehydrogenase family)